MQKEKYYYKPEHGILFNKSNSTIVDTEFKHWPTDICLIEGEHFYLKCQSFISEGVYADCPISDYSYNNGRIVAVPMDAIAKILSMKQETKWDTFSPIRLKDEICYEIMKRLHHSKLKARTTQALWQIEQDIDLIKYFQNEMSMLLRSDPSQPIWGKADLIESLTIDLKSVINWIDRGVDEAFNKGRKWQLRETIKLVNSKV